VLEEEDEERSTATACLARFRPSSRCFMPVHLCASSIHMNCAGNVGKVARECATRRWHGESVEVAKSFLSDTNAAKRWQIKFPLELGLLTPKAREQRT